MKDLKDVNSLASIFFERFFEDWKLISPNNLFLFIKTKIEQAITLDELKELLNLNRKLNIKFGIDPTGADVHLGHILPIMILRQFQKAGHQINIIIGDFTALIGDPSGRNTQRPSLTPNQIKDNFKTYQKQMGKYLNIKNVKILKNSKWLSKINLEEIIKDLSKIKLSEILQRNDFRERLEKKYSLSVAEILYSYAQAIDSVKIKADIELGGNDQLLNFAHARNMMQIYGMKPEVAITTPILEGIFGDGKKMSKSYGNYIPVNASCEEKFGKIMSIPDNLIIKYFKAFADIKIDELSLLEKMTRENPLETKKQLAQFLVSIEARKLENGENERKKFENKFSSHKNFENLEKIYANKNTTVFDVIHKNKIIESKNELRRLFEQNGIHMLSPEEKTLKTDDMAYNGVIRIGKKIFYKIIIK